MESKKSEKPYSKDTILRVLFILCCAAAFIAALVTFVGNLTNGEAVNALPVIAMVYFIVAMLVQTFFPGRNAKWYIIAGSFFTAMLPTDFFLKMLVSQHGNGDGLSLIMMIILLGIWMFVNATAKKWSAERRAEGHSFEELLGKMKK